MGPYIFIATVLFLYSAHADNVQDQIEGIQRLQAEKHIFEAQQEHRQDNKPPVYTQLQKQMLKHGSASGKCIHIHSIDTHAVTRISALTLKRIKKRYLNRCDTIDDLQNLMTEINNVYIEKAYITSRAYLKAQNISSGHLVVSAMEGKIESIIGEGVQTALVFPFAHGSYLNLRDLEVGIEQLSRLQSIQASMALVPGEKEGYSKVLIKGQKTGFPVHGSLGVNNYGTAKSGKYQLSGSLSWDNPLGLNDLLSFSANTTNKQDPHNRSRGYSFRYGFPVGRAYLEYSYSRFKYDQVVNGLNKDYNSNGISKSHQLKMEYKLFHTKKQKGALELSLTRKRNDNYLAGVYLNTSSSVLTIARMAYTHSFTGKTWDGYATLTYHKGLNILGAKTGTKASPSFSKLTLDVSYNKKLLEETNASLLYNFSLHGQYAKADILGSEQMGAGGPYSVRGFKSAGQISGNKGFYVRNELTLNQRFALGTFSPYVALDFAKIAHNKQSHGGHILGGALGVRMQLKSFSLDVFKSFPVVDSNKVTYKPNGDKVVKRNNGFLGLSLSYRF